MNPAAPDVAVARRGRRTLILLFALFLGPILLAMVMGWLNLQPSANRSKGELLSPKPDLRALVLQRADGSAYAWQPELRLWRIVLAPPPDWCASQAVACAKLARDLDKVWQLFGRHADHAQVLWFGTPPAQLPRPPEWQAMRAAPRLSAALPRNQASAAGASVYVVDPYGYVVLRYAPGFDPADLRADMAKLLKLK